MGKGEMKEVRIGMFGKYVVICEEYKHVNYYE